MKALHLIIIALLFLPFSISGQGLVKHFVFSDFEPAEVHYKNKEIKRNKLNYNKITGEMIFVGSDGKNKALFPIDQIDTIYIHDRIFIPWEKEFFEVLLAEKHYKLYVTHRCRVSITGQSTGYGSSSTSATHNLSSINGNGEVYQLDLPNNYKVDPYYTFYLDMDGNMTKFRKIKELNNLFPKQKDVIKQYIKEHKAEDEQQKIFNLVKLLMSS